MLEAIFCAVRISHDTTAQAQNDGMAEMASKLVPRKGEIYMAAD
jgi:hypothetical protein